MLLLSAHKSLIFAFWQPTQPDAFGSYVSVNEPPTFLLPPTFITLEPSFWLSPHIQSLLMYVFPALSSWPTKLMWVSILVWWLSLCVSLQIFVLFSSVHQLFRHFLTKLKLSNKVNVVHYIMAFCSNDVISQITAQFNTKCRDPFNTSEISHQETRQSLYVCVCGLGEKNN